MRTIGVKIKRARVAKGLTEEEVAKRVGISKELLLNYESQKILPNLEILTDIINALNMDYNDIAMEDTKMSIERYRELREFNNIEKEEFYKKVAGKAAEEKRLKRINSHEKLKELAEVLDKELVERLDIIYNEGEKLFKQRQYEEVKFRSYEIFKQKYYAEIKEEFFHELNFNIRTLIESSYENLENYMKRYFQNEKNNELLRRKIKAIETFVMLKEIFKKYDIKWAILGIEDNNIDWFDIFTVVVLRGQKEKVYSLLDLIALKVEEDSLKRIYKINNIKFEVRTEVKRDNIIYNLKNYKIKYYLIENERLPGLIEKNI